MYVISLNNVGNYVGVTGRTCFLLLCLPLLILLPPPSPLIGRAVAAGTVKCVVLVNVVRVAPAPGIKACGHTPLCQMGCHVQFGVKPVDL